MIYNALPIPTMIMKQIVVMMEMYGIELIFVMINVNGKMMAIHQILSHKIVLVVNLAKIQQQLVNLIVQELMKIVVVLLVLIATLKELVNVE